MPNYRYPMQDYSRAGGCCPPRADNTGNRRNPCCEDHSDRDPLSGMPLAMAFVPWQNWRAIYDVEKGFHCGTIFEELNKPFRGTGGYC